MADAAPAHVDSHYASQRARRDYFRLQTVATSALLKVTFACIFQALAASSQFSLLVNSAVTMVAGIERLRTSVRMRMYTSVLRSMYEALMNTKMIDLVQLR